MPILLLEEMDQALRRTPAPMVYIGNLGKELSPAAAGLSLRQKLELMEQHIGKRVIDAVLVGPQVDVSEVGDRLVIQQPLEASDIRYRHDRQLLRAALEQAVQQLG
ncbi:Uncharacterised protein family UPF0052 [Cedecea neteri]|uniref:Uncharacterized protein n=2 Tax=Cedecea neteri TaxID=158822 RepID=A0A2X2TB91_9ENTR|nr:Uncharacterised protein family UPF0052 [Cedecea neteri]